jgi:hypothetical protein
MSTQDRLAINRAIREELAADIPKHRNCDAISEHNHQVTLFEWIDWNANIDARLKNAFAVPNGGFRAMTTAKVLKAEGVKRGVPDLFLMWPAHGFGFLAIEMKSKKGTCTTEQLEWVDRLQNAGGKVMICHSADEAIGTIKLYLSI